jgi:hypothetical protein
MGFSQRNLPKEISEMSKLKLIALGGEPATGKTTVFRNLRGKMRLNSTFNFGLVRARCNKESTRIMVGVFDGTVHEGTDKLSMAVQPDFLKLLKALKKLDKRITVVFEGDRLFNASLFEKAEVDELSIYILQTKNQSQNIIKRGTTQPEQFLQSKKTKVQNIMNKFSHKLLNNDEPEDVEKCASVIFDEVESWV